MRQVPEWRYSGGMPTLLIVHHSPSRSTTAIADLVIDAARDAATHVNQEALLDEALAVEVVNPLEPSVEQLREADALIFGTTANFGYISGALKHYFDSTFMHIGEDLRGIPMSWWIRGGYDVTGARKAMASITTGYGWSPTVPPVEFTGEIEPQQADLADMAQAVVGQLVE